MSIEKTIEELLGDPERWSKSLSYFEEQGDDVIKVNVNPKWPSTWPWPGKPFTVRFKGKLSQEFKMVDYQISLANPAECLTSRIPYIRECKKWQIQEQERDE